MERIGFLINKLKEQYEKADSHDNMLVTLQMLYRELMPKLDSNLAVGKIAVTIPGLMDMTFLERSMDQKIVPDSTPNNIGKQVFELSVEPLEEIITVEPKPVVEVKPVEKPLIAEVPKVEQPAIVEQKQTEKPVISVVEAPKNPFIKVAPKVEIPTIKNEQTEIVVPNIEQSAPVAPKPTVIDEANARYMPQQIKPIVETPIEQKVPIVTVSELQPLPPITPPQPALTPKVMATVVPPREVHETIQPESQPSVNDKVEKRQPELFNVLKSEPLKDLKKAISINERFQYINHLFMKDETMYERSLKTINNFNVFSEAHFWIRKELATKMGWSDDDEVVQQFMNLVERRFL